MNVYIVTEGKAEAAVYRKWIPLVNPQLRPIDNIADTTHNTFFLISGKGYPDYFRRIEDGILDVNLYLQFDRLVIIVDSEEMPRQEKYQEILDFVSHRPCRAQVKIVVQHFCFETWALGNKKIVRSNCRADKLREYQRMFNVRVSDPELLPPKQDEALTRVRFAEKYLRLALNDRFRTLTYSKSNPWVVAHHTYFAQVKQRLEATTHIGSFRDFLAAFV